MTEDGTRFAFYGRVSTEDQQDPGPRERGNFSGAASWSSPRAVASSRSSSTLGSPARSPGSVARRPRGSWSCSPTPTGASRRS